MDVIKPTIQNHFVREQLKLKDNHFRDRISYLQKQFEECLHKSSLKYREILSYRQILNLPLKKLVATTEEPLTDSNSINIHHDSYKSSAVNITNDDRDINYNSVKDIDNRSKSSNGNSTDNNSGRWDGNANGLTRSKNVSKKCEMKKKIYVPGESMV